MTLVQEASTIQREIIATRRKIHEHPELSYNEKQTARLVARKLRALGIEVKTGIGGTGVVGLLEGKDGGKVVALRADMDALPVQEMTGEVFKSKVKGVMHACGHDSHVAMLLGAAMLLTKHKKDLKGSVKFLFQPAEEHGGKGGAKPMIRAGDMRDPDVDYVFGLHIYSDLPSGVFGLRAGPLMAAPDAFKIRIIGKGGHGSAPQQTVDPIFLAAQVINVLQGISGRMVDPVEPFVISVCSVHSGTKNNIIPDEAILEGTIRTLSPRLRSQALTKVRETVKAICRAYGAKCEIEFMEDAYPITINDKAVTEKVFKILRGIKGTRTMEVKPLLGGEDFSRFLREAPGTFYFLGTYNKRKGCTFPNHSSRFKIDEEVLKYGAASLATVALNFMNSK
jgi:carboxypeptidase Ss1